MTVAIDLVALSIVVLPVIIVMIVAFKGKQLSKDLKRTLTETGLREY